MIYEDSYEEQIAYIMANFNFKNVHAYMTLTNWKWSLGNVPSYDEIVGHAKKQLEDIAFCPRHKDTTYVSCGGFESSLINGHLELKFILEECVG